MPDFFAGPGVRRILIVRNGSQEVRFMAGSKDPLLHYLERPGRRRLACVVKVYHEFVWATAFRVTRNAEDAADISQEVFLKLLVDPPRPDSVASPAGYLAWRVIGAAARRRRTGERRRAREEAAARSARENGIASEDLDALHAAIADLPEDLRLTIELRYLAGLQNREIAATLGISERTVEERVHRAREALKRRLMPLALGSLLAMDALGGPHPPPPPPLVSQLLRIVRMGSALAPSAGSLVIGGAIMVKKVAIALGVIVLGLVVWLASPRIETWRSARPDSALLSSHPGESVGTSPAGPKDTLSDQRGDSLEPRQEPPRATLRGIVFDEQGARVPHAVVRIISNIEQDRADALRGQGYRDIPIGECSYEVEADESGAYRIPSLLPVRVRVTATAERLRWGHLNGARLEAGEETVLNLELCPTYRLMGDITDVDGNPLPGAQVFFDSIGCCEPRETGILDADDMAHYDTGFRLVMSPPRSFGDRLEVVAWAKGFARKKQWIRRDQFQDRQARLDFQLDPEMPVRIRVVDPAGMPIEGVTLVVDAQLRFTTDREGLAAIDHLAPDTHSLSVQEDGYYMERIEIQPGDPSERRVTLQPLGMAIEARLAPDERIPLDDWRREFAWAQVSLHGEDGLQVAYNGRKDENELRCLFWPRRPGRYFIQYQMDFVNGVARTQPFEYTGTEPVYVTLEVGPPAFFVSGIILRPGREEPASGVPVSVNYFQEGEQGWDRIRSVNGFAFPEMPGNSLATTSEKDGRFRILLARGDERFGHIEGGFLRIRAGSFKEGWSEDLVFPFTKGTVLSGLRVEILTPGSIEGHVARADGEPALSELVAAYDGHGILRWVISGEDGNYRIDGLRPGDHAIEALGRVFSPLQGGGSGGPSKIEGMPAPHELFRRPVRVEAGKVTTWNIDLAKDRLGEVQGRLLGCLPGDGEVHYSMVIAGQACVPRCLGGGVRASAGEFALKNLLPGTYRFWIESDSATQAEALADVSRGEVSHVALSSP